MEITNGKWGITDADISTLNGYEDYDATYCPAPGAVLRPFGSAEDRALLGLDIDTSGDGFPQLRRSRKVPGRKDDTGKLDMTLLDDMPRALEAVVEVMQWAITKKAPAPYIRSSWLGVSPERYDAAILRHHFGAAKQAAGLDGSPALPPKFQRDAETKLLHAAHKATSALFALELTLRELEKQ